jgi:hypothetical protein
MTDGMIERVARALRVADAADWRPDYYQHMARTAIKVMRDSLTDEMCLAAKGSFLVTRDEVEDIWQAMVDAALNGGE